jgi:hypothetical protein
MGLEKRGEIWYFTKRINGQRFRESTGFADKKSAERRAVEIEHDIRAGVHGWKSTTPSFAEWWAVYRETYTRRTFARRCSSRPRPVRERVLPPGSYGVRFFWVIRRHAPRVMTHRQASGHKSSHTKF